MDVLELIKFIEFNSWLDYLIAIYLGSFIIQLFYYLFVFVRLAFHKDQDFKGNYEPVSVIILLLNSVAS